MKVGVTAKLSLAVLVVGAGLIARNSLYRVPTVPHDAAPASDGGRTWVLMTEAERRENERTMAGLIDAVKVKR